MPVQKQEIPSQIKLDTKVGATNVKSPLSSANPTGTTQQEPLADPSPTTTEVSKEVDSQEPTSVSLAKPAATSSPKPTSPASTPEPWTQDNIALSSNDLLFVSQGSIIRWNSESQEIETWVSSESTSNLSGPTTTSGNYPGKILSYSQDEQVNKIAMLRSKGITANGVELFNLDLYDVNSGEAWTIVDNTTRISRMTISPDGEWIAYKKEEYPSQIVLSPVYEGDSDVEINISGDGSRILDDFEWSPDSRFLAWIDAGGIWLSDPQEFQPRLAVPSTIGVTYYGGEQSEILVEYESLDWSPQGRYLLTNVRPRLSEVSWMGIADTDRGQVSEIPGSFSPGDLIRNVEWTSEGDLVVINKVNQDEDTLSSLQVWRVVPTHDELILPELNINLSKADALPSVLRTLQEHNLAYPRKLDYRYYSFITVPAGPSDESSIFIYDTITNELIKICKLPLGTVDVVWSGDRQGAIVVGRHDSAIIAALDGDADDLYQIMGMDSCCFRWLPQD
jgi:hypothetical protein